MENYVVLRPVEQRFGDLYLCYCGYESCDPLYSFGPAVRPNYLIHLILSGRGVFQTQSSSVTLEAGQGFFIEPRVPTFYQADKDDPWTYLWVGFDGRVAPQIVQLLGLGGDKRTFRSPRGEELKRIVVDMLRTSGVSAQREFELESLLYRFFAELLRDIEVTLPPERGSENLYVQEALRYIQNHYSEPITVADIAAHVGINRSYLYTLFKEGTGVGPQRYLQTFRLSRAADLLNHTTYSIELVAASSGYRDPLVFSKAFKQQYGVTPTGYRVREHADASEKLRRGKGELDSL